MDEVYKWVLNLYQIVNEFLSNNPLAEFLIDKFLLPFIILLVYIVRKIPQINSEIRLEKLNEDRQQLESYKDISQPHVTTAIIEPLLKTTAFLTLSTSSIYLLSAFFLPARFIDSSFYAYLVLWYSIALVGLNRRLDKIRNPEKYLKKIQPKIKRLEERTTKKK